MPSTWNTELFKLIHQQVEAEIASLSMSAWEWDWDENRIDADKPACGTTRCVAGWGIFFTTGAPVYNSNAGSWYSRETKALAAQLKLPGNSGESTIGRRVLGLEIAVSSSLFYETNAIARQFIALAAVERHEEALAVLDLNDYSQTGRVAE